MKGKLAIIFASICLGTIGVFVKYIGNDVPIMTLSFLRLFIAVLFLAAVLPFIDKKAFRFSRKDLKDYILIGLLFAVDFTLYNTAMLKTHISNVAIIDTSIPFVVLVLSFFFLREKITKTKVIVVILSIIAIFVINPLRSKGSFTGNILALCAVVTYATLLTYMRNENLQHTVGVIFWYFVFGTIFLSPMPFIYGFGNIAAKWHYVLALGIISTAMAYGLITYGLKRVQAGITAILEGIFTPLIALIFAFTLFREPASLWMIIGGAILVCSGMYIELKKLKT